MRTNNEILLQNTTKMMSMGSPKINDKIQSLKPECNYDKLK